MVSCFTGHPAFNKVSGSWLSDSRVQDRLCKRCAYKKEHGLNPHPVQLLQLALNSDEGSNY